MSLNNKPSSAYTSNFGINILGYKTWVGPGLLAILFMTVSLSLVIYLHNTQNKQEQNRLEDNLHIARSNLETKINNLTGNFETIAQQRAWDELDLVQFKKTASLFCEDNPEAAGIMWVEKNGLIKDVVPPDELRPWIGVNGRTAPDMAKRMDYINRTGEIVYSEIHDSIRGTPIMAIWVPVNTGTQNQIKVSGYICGVINMQRILSKILPENIRDRYYVTLRDSRGAVLVQTHKLRTLNDNISKSIEIPHPRPGVRLELIAYRKGFVPDYGIMFMGFICISLAFGMAYGIWLLNKDIEVRKKIESNLRTSEARYRILGNYLPNGAVVLVDKDLRYLLVDGTIFEKIDIKKKDMVGKTIYEADPPYVVAVLEPHFKEALNGTPSRFNLTINGVILDFQVVPVPDDDGNIETIMVVALDITDQIKAQEALLESEDRFKTFMEKFPGFISIKEANHQIIFYNSHAKTFFGNNDLVGKTLKDILKEDLAQNLMNIEDRAVAGETIETISPYINHLGKTYFYRTLTFPISREGKPTLVGRIGIDVTDIKLMTDELKRHKDNLEELVQSRTSELSNALEKVKLLNTELESFSYSVSHDLRAPLRAINGFTQILIEDYSSKLDDEGRRVLGVILSSSVKLGQLIDDLLAFSRAGRVEVKKSLIDIEALFHEVCNEIESGDLYKAHPCTFIINSVPQCWGDRNLLRQVLTNLLSNAIKFSQYKTNAKVEVTGWTEQGYHIYAVKDNGAGFDMQYVDKLFGVFQRLHDSKEFEGTGIGLSICAKIIQRHGGTINAKGQINEGATITFTLPIVEEERE